MKHMIEITGLTPKIDPATLQMKQGVVLAYKKQDGKFEQMELDSNLVDIMNMLGIKNLQEAVGNKYEMEIGDDNRLRSITQIDNRPVGLADIERLQKGIEKILTMLGQHISDTKQK